MTSELMSLGDIGKAIAKQGLDLQSALDALIERANEGKGQQERPALPSKIAISASARKALRTIPSRIAEAELPDEIRALTEEEKAEFIPMFDQIKDAKAALETAEKALKEIFHNDMDVEYLGHPDAVFDWDTHGHVARSGEVVTPEYPKKVVRHERGGKANLPSVVHLQALEESGVIDHKAFLRMTRPVPATREPDLVAIMREVESNPAILVHLADAVGCTAKGTTLTMGKNEVVV